MAPHRNHVESRSSRAPARQYVAESHDHKPDAPSRAESRSAAKHTAGTAAGGRKLKEWSGSPCPIDPDNFWIDDETGERVNATTGERTAALAKAEGGAA